MLDRNPHLLDCPAKCWTVDNSGLWSYTRTSRSGSADVPVFISPLLPPPLQTKERCRYDNIAWQMYRLRLCPIPSFAVNTWKDGNPTWTFAVSSVKFYGFQEGGKTRLLEGVLHHIHLMAIWRLICLCLFVCFSCLSVTVLWPNRLKINNIKFFLCTTLNCLI